MVKTIIKGFVNVFGAKKVVKVATSKPVREIVKKIIKKKFK